MKCTEARHNLSSYMDHALDQSTTAAVEEHLRSCAACAAEMADMTACRSRVQRLPVKKAPPGFLQAVRARLDDFAPRKECGFFARWGIPLEFAGLSAALVFVVLFSDVLTKSRTISEQLLTVPEKETPATEAVVSADSQKSDLNHEQGMPETYPRKSKTVYSFSKAVRSAEKPVVSDAAEQPVLAQQEQKIPVPAAPAPAVERAAPRPAERFHYNALQSPEASDTLKRAGQPAGGIAEIGNLLKAQTGALPKTGAAPAAFSGEMRTQMKSALRLEPGALRLTVSAGMRDAVVRALASRVQQLKGRVTSSRAAGAVHLIAVTIPAHRSSDLSRDLARLGTVEGTLPQSGDSQSTLSITITIAEKPAR